MKYAADFRRIARNALRGKWAIAVIAGLLAALLGGIANEGPEINLDISDSGMELVLEVADQEIYIFGEDLSQQFASFIRGQAASIILFALIMAAVNCIIGSVIAAGYSRFNLDMVDGEKTAEIGVLFKYFPHWRTTAATRFMKGVFVFLWSLLFIIPGIIAGYSYAMTDYILAENPEMTASEAIARSKEMMKGNRGRLFCLQLSFIGWALLSALTFGIGQLWLRPYEQTAIAAFYREVSGTERYVLPAEE